MSITKADMRKSIYQQVVNTQKLYYSFVSKSQQTLSIMKNQRFLIFNQTKGHLYYINQPQKLPFATAVPPPKNNVIADMNLSSIVKGTGNEFNVQFITNKQKNQMGEWNFICENNSLSTAWVKLLQEYKDMKKNEIKKIQQPKKQISLTKINDVKDNPFNNNTTVSNNNQLGYSGNDKISEVVVRNNLGYTNVQPLKGDQPIGSNTNINTKPITNTGNTNTTNINPNPSTTNNNNTNILPPLQLKPQQTKPLTNSNLTNVNNTSNQPITNTNTNTNTNINNQPVTLNNSKTQPVDNDPTINIKQPITSNNNMGNSRQSLPSPQLYNSNMTNTVISNTLSRQPLNRTPSANSLNNNNNSRQKLSQQQSNNNNSRLTFKDQIESIIAKSRLSQNNTNQFNTNNNSNLRQSINTKSTYKREKDWNWRFFNNPSENIIYEFQQYSITSLKSILKEDRLSNQTLRVYLQPQSLIIVTNFGSVEAKKIKSEFRNYHFIMEAIKVQPYGQIIGVPLTCLIEYQGLVVMVKSLIPQHAPKVQCTQQLLLQIKQLQRYTRVKNSILKKSTLYDLSNIYETTGKRLLFLNQLIQYLPVHTDQLFYGSLLRPQHLLDNVNQFMHGGLGYQATRQDLKIFDQVTQIIKQNTIELAKQISCGDVKFTNGQQLKNIMHERGINLKYLSLLYNQTTNKQVKKYVHSFMVAKIAKQDILSNIVSTRPDRMKASSKPQQHIRQLVQKSIKLLVQGNSNVSNQLWKEISLTFKKQYGIPISNSDIHGPFFMNSLMGLMKGKYDLKRCNMNKTMFRDQHIVGSGFVVEVGMKVKSYYRWMSEDVQSLMQICKAQKRDEMELVGVCEMLQLKKKTIPKQLQMCRITPLLEEYMTAFIPPPQFQPNQFQHLNLYESISLQPPTTHSLNITVNYLKWCLQFGHVQQFKMAIDQALQLIDLWLGVGNAQKGSVFQCEFYQLLSQYYYQQGSVDDSINFLKQSLAMIIRNNGLGSKKIGNGYYMLGEREMKAGRWNESLQSFLKAKQSMQSSSAISHINYPKTLLKLSQLYLNSNQFQNSLLYAKQSIQQFQKQQSISMKQQQSQYPKQVYDQFCIKAIQVMTRVFEIENKKNQLHRMAQMTAAKYNKTKSKKVYQEVIKITLTSMINKASYQKAKLLLSLIQKTISPTIDAIQQQNNPQLKLQSIQQLMSLSLQYNVMQKLMMKFESLQRIVTDINGKRTMGSDTKEFINILKPIINIVGEEFIYGLVEQREVEE